MKTAPAGRLHPGFQPETRQYLVNELGRSHDPRSRGVGDRIFANLCFLADVDTPQRPTPSHAASSYKARPSRQGSGAGSAGAWRHAAASTSSGLAVAFVALTALHFCLGAFATVNRERPTHVVRFLERAATGAPHETFVRPAVDQRALRRLLLRPFCHLLSQRGPACCNPIWVVSCAFATAN